MTGDPQKPPDTGEKAPGAIGPTGWWRWGLVALLAIIVVLLAMRLLSGNSGTAVIPGTPVAAPQTGQSAQ